MKKYTNNLSLHHLPTNKQRHNKIMLNLNENAFKCSKKVKNSIKKKMYSIYPDDNATELCYKLSEFLKVDKDEILIGNGSGEILQMISRFLIEKNDEVITCVPTYPYYEVETIIEGGKFIGVPLKDNTFDIDGILNAITKKTKIIYITNPNNPTGTIIKQKELDKLIKKVRKNILIVIDEAYYEYVSDNNYPDSIQYIKKYENVCILRTFSKAYGLASFRIGYLVGNKNFIDNLNRIRLTFNTSSAAQQAAIDALSDQKFINKVRKRNDKIKEYLYSELDKLQIYYIKSQANFVMIKIDDNVKNKLEKNNIVVKHCHDEYNDYIRLTIGTKKQMKLFLKNII